MDKRKKSIMRPPIVEGIFYPSDTSELFHQIDTFCLNKEKGNAPVIVTPHAGYAVAGELMAAAFLSAAGAQIEEVVILSPLHREEQEKIILPGYSVFQTPAGELEVNMKSLHMFKSDDPSIIRDDIPHMEEHAIEDQLPFISHILGDVKILPVLLGKTTINMVKKLTRALERTYGSSPEKVLFVVTSNLSDYEPEKTALLNGEKALNTFKEGDWRKICEEKRTKQINACGAGVLAAVMALYEKKLEMKVLGRAVSEMKESEKGKIVVYGALSFMEKL
jgi:AmmeMemoRadiSam system protein B